MSSSLFRKEALEHRKDRLYGDVVLLQPLSMTVLVSVVVAVCLLIMTILLWGTYARKETVRGYLVPDKGIVKTYVPQPGTIAKVHVREGDEVKEGQALVTILSERSVQGGSAIESMQLKELEATRASLQEQIQGEKALQVSRHEQLKTQIIGLEHELREIGQSLKNQESRNDILEKRLAGAKKLLQSKNISEMEYQKLHDEFLAQQQQHHELLRTKVNRENNLVQAKAELEQLPINSAARINDIENKISELNQRHAEIHGRRSFEIRAPIGGTVTALQAREGQMYVTNTPLLALIPKGAQMQAELLVPSRAIGFISQGQTVRIRYDAFPYRRYGIYEGKVAVISKHALLPAELSIPMELKEPVYRILIDLKDQNVMAYGQAFPLQAGMSIEADIILDKQTLFKWILDPIMSLKGRL